MKRHIILTSVVLVLILQLQKCSTANTITKHETIEEPNGIKMTSMQSWSSSDGTANDSDHIDQMKAAAVEKGMDPLAVEEVLRTNAAVVRNYTDGEGNKHTTTYSPTANGGITSHTHIQITSRMPLEDANKHSAVGPIPIDEFLRSYKPNSRPFADTDSTTFDTRQPYRPNWSTVQSTPEQTYSPTSAQDINKDVEVFSTHKITSNTAPTGPRTSIFDNPNHWPVSPFDDVNNKRNEQPEVFTKHTTTNDDNGNTVSTKWTTRTYTFPTMPHLIPTSTFDTYFTSTTPRPLINLEPSQKPTKTFSLDDLPIQRMPADLRPVNQNEFTNTKTFKIDNIPMTDIISQAHLNPEIEAALQKAGITPNEIRASNGVPIVRTRVEPDGKIVRTTYSVKPVVYDAAAPARRPFEDFKPTNFPTTHHFEDDLHKNFNNHNWNTNNYNPPPTTTTTEKPQIFDESITLPINWQWKLVPQLSTTMRAQLEKFGLSDDEIQDGYNKPIVKIRTDASGRLVRTKYTLRDSTRPAPSNVADFLLRVDLHPDDILLRNGRGITKTIVDDDGRILTANFRLSYPLNGGGGSNANGNNATADSSEKSTVKPLK